MSKSAVPRAALAIIRGAVKKNETTYSHIAAQREPCEALRPRRVGDAKTSPLKLAGASHQCFGPHESSEHRSITSRDAPSMPLHTVHRGRPPSHLSSAPSASRSLLSLPRWRRLDMFASGQSRSWSCFTRVRNHTRGAQLAAPRAAASAASVVASHPPPMKGTRFPHVVFLS